MAARDGRRRVPIPTGKEAEEELRRLRRQERRRARAARKRAEAAGEEYVEENEFDTDNPSPVDGSLTPPTAEELRADLMYAFNNLGGRAGLVAWGKRYPKEFYALWMKHCLPREDGGGEASGGLEGLLAQLDKRRGKETVQ